MAGSLSAGYSLPQAVDTVVRDGQDPIADRVQPGARRDPARRPDRGRAETHRRPDAQQGLGLGRHGDPRSSARSAATWPSCSSRWRRRCASGRASAARSRRCRPRAGCPPGSSAACRSSSPSTCSSSRPELHPDARQEPLGWLMIVGGVILMTVGGLWMRKIVERGGLTMADIALIVGLGRDLLSPWSSSLATDRRAHRRARAGRPQPGRGAGLPGRTRQHARRARPSRSTSGSSTRWSTTAAGSAGASLPAARSSGSASGSTPPARRPAGTSTASSPSRCIGALLAGLLAIALLADPR